MHKPSRQYGRITLTAPDSVGQVKRQYPVNAVSTDRASTRGEIEAQALRVFAASGFGEAAIGDVEPHRVLDSVELYHRARAHRSYQLAEIISTALQAVGDVVRRMITRAKLQQRARATYLALHALDARTLRDLGFHRSELMSGAAEITGGAESTRARFAQRF